MKLGHKLLLAPLLTSLVLFGAGQINALMSARHAKTMQAQFSSQIGVFKNLSATQEQLAQAHADVYRTVASRLPGLIVFAAASKVRSIVATISVSLSSKLSW